MCLILFTPGFAVVETVGGGLSLPLAMLSYLSKLLPRLEHAPGIAAAAGTAGAATFVASQLPSQLHISAIPVSIVLGAAAGNAAPSAVTAAIKPGLSYATSNILRTGIVCVGAKLSAAQILALGWTTVPAAACSVGAGVTIIPMLAARFGLAPRLGALLACGTSICGVTAISAVAPAIAATQAEVAIAVANVVAFGSVGMLVYPHVAAALFPPSDSRAIGLFLGLAVHDTAQVISEHLGQSRCISTSSVSRDPSETLPTLFPSPFRDPSGILPGFLQVMGCAASYAEQYSDAAVAKSGSGGEAGWQRHSLTRCGLWTRLSGWQRCGGRAVRRLRCCELWLTRLSARRRWRS